MTDRSEKDSFLRCNEAFHWVGVATQEKLNIVKKFEKGEKTFFVQICKTYVTVLLIESVKKIEYCVTCLLYQGLMKLRFSSEGGAVI